MPAAGVEYDVTGHILLSVDAAALDPEALRGHNQAAELNLGLIGTAYTGVALDRALVAVVRQVNRQVATEATRRQGLKSEREGERSYEYVTGGPDAALEELDGQAVLIVQHLRATTPANWL